MSQFRVDIEGVALTHEPQGVREFTQQIVRDEEKRIIYSNQPNDLTFWGEGYDVLRGYLDSRGYGGEVEVQIYKQCTEDSGMELEIEGLIKLSDIEEDLEECTIKVRILDQSFASRLDNNRTISVSADTPKSKNSVDITPCPSVELTFFLPVFAANNGGFPNPGTRTCYDFFEVIKHAVAFMSDNEVDVISDWYNNLPDDERLAVVTGRELRIRNDDAPDRDFDTYWEDFYKLFNLWSSIDLSGTKPALRIERDDYFFAQNNSATVTNVKKIIRQFFPDLLYTGINFGGADVWPDPSVSSFPNPAFLGFREESYYFTGQNNVSDNDLDLTVQFIIDTNIIEQVVVQNDDSWDDELFLVQYNRNSLEATKCDFFQTPAIPARYYNLTLTNNKVAERYDAQGNVAKFFGNGQDTFLAGMNSAQTKTGQINYDFSDVYQDDSTPPNNDPNGNFQLTNPAIIPGNVSTYICPVAGIYTFETYYGFRLIDEPTNPTGVPFVNAIAASIDRYASNGTTLIQQNRNLITYNQVWAKNPAPNGLYTFSHTATFWLDAGDRVYFRFGATIWDNNAAPGSTPGCAIQMAKVQNDTYAECTATTNTGGLYQQNDPSAYKVSKNSFRKFVTDDQRRAMISNPGNFIGYDIDGSTDLRGWPSAVEINMFDGAASFDLITDPDQ